MERSQKKIHRKDELTWPAHILKCSPHVLSHVLAWNGTSLLAVTCPCKNQTGWPFWCPYRNVVFFGLEPCTGRPTLKSQRSKLGLRSTSSNAIISRNAHGPITGLQNQNKKPYNKQLTNLERSVFTGKSQISALLYWPRYRSVNTARSRFEIFSVKTSLSVRK